MKIVRSEGGNASISISKQNEKLNDRNNFWQAHGVREHYICASYLHLSPPL